MTKHLRWIKIGLVQYFMLLCWLLLVSGSVCFSAIYWRYLAEDINFVCIVQRCFFPESSERTGFDWISLHFQLTAFPWKQNAPDSAFSCFCFAPLFSRLSSVWSLAGCFYCRMNCCRVAFTELAPYLVAVTYNVFGGKNNGTPCEKKTMKMISPGFLRLAFCISRTLSHTHLPKHTHSLTCTGIQVHTRTLSLALAPFSSHFVSKF